MLFYFTFAVGYDIYITVAELVNSGTAKTFHTDQPHVYKNASHSGTVVIENITQYLLLNESLAMR